MPRPYNRWNGGLNHSPKNNPVYLPAIVLCSFASLREIGFAFRPLTPDP